MTDIRFHLAQLRHAYAQLAAGTVKDQKEFAEGLIAPAIAALERSTAEPRPKIGFTYEPTQERVTIYFDGPRSMAIVLEHPEVMAQICASHRQIAEGRATLMENIDSEGWKQGVDHD